ncbi:olfactory receptor 10AG1-like [Gastrophryne carolinensis]
MLVPVDLYWGSSKQTRSAFIDSGAAGCMQSLNDTSFVLLGFQNLHTMKPVLSGLLLMVYCVTLLVNTIVIFLVALSKALQTPMYIFLTQLSISDILVSTDVVPNMLHIVINDRGLIPLEWCLIQIGFFGVSEVFECLLLSVMSYDRYVAICRPLHYNSIMNQKKCLIFIISCWSYSFSTIMIQSVHLTTLYFCGSNIIDHFFCDFEPLLKLSCTDLFSVRLLASVLGSPVIVLSFLAIIASYFNILTAILRILSETGRQKIQGPTQASSVIPVDQFELACRYQVSNNAALIQNCDALNTDTFGTTLNTDRQHSFSISTSQDLSLLHLRGEL